MAKKILAFDWETTSNQPGSTRGVQLAAVIQEPDGSRHPFMNLIVNPGPGHTSHHEAALIHGITEEMTRGQPRDHLMAKKLYDKIHDIRDDVILGTHNGTTFDLPILWRLAMEDADIDRPKMVLPHIDTIVCATRLWPNAPNHKLSVPAAEQKEKGLGPGLTQHLGLGTGENAHDAEADIHMVLDLINHICKNFKPNGASLSPDELAEWCAIPRVLKTCHFGKHKGKPWGKGPGCVPAGYVFYIKDKFDDATPDMQATVKHHYNMEFTFARLARYRAEKAARLAAENSNG